MRVGQAILQNLVRPQASVKMLVVQLVLLLQSLCLALVSWLGWGIVLNTKGLQVRSPVTARMGGKLLMVLSLFLCLSLSPSLSKNQ